MQERNSHATPHCQFCRIVFPFIQTQYISEDVPSVNSKWAIWRDVRSGSTTKSAGRHVPGGTGGHRGKGSENQDEREWTRVGEGGSTVGAAGPSAGQPGGILWEEETAFRAMVEAQRSDDSEVLMRRQTGHILLGTYYEISKFFYLGALLPKKKYSAVIEKSVFIYFF